MAFVKLDCGILNSTLWCDADARTIFITALLMAEPFEVLDKMPQIEVRSLKETGFVVPAGWYGFVAAAGVGIIRQAGLGQEEGLSALERLGTPESESRTPDFEGRRLVRVNGGYLLLNYDKYRQKDHSAAERQARYRLRKKASRYGVTTQSNGVTSRHVTQAEAEAEADVLNERKNARAVLLSNEKFKEAWNTHLEGLREIGKERQLKNRHFGFCERLIEDGSTVEEVIAALENSVNHGFKFVRDPKLMA